MLKQIKGAIVRTFIRFSSLALAMSVAWVPLPALCQSASEQIDAQLKKCLEGREAPTTADMRDCMGAAYKKMDARLNEVYRGLMTRFPEKRKELLRDSQRKWLAFREAELKLSEELDPNAGGTAALLASDSFAYAMLKQRVDDLERYLEQDDPEAEEPN